MGYIHGVMAMAQGRAAVPVIGTTAPFIEGGRATRVYPAVALCWLRILFSVLRIQDQIMFWS
jgi:hypothetical protein